MSSSDRPTFDSEFGSVLGSVHGVDELVQRIREGDQDASAMLYDRYVRRLIGLVRRELPPIYRTRFDSEDVVQSALSSFFVRMRKGDFDFRSSGQLWHLLAAIAMNKLREKKRNHSRGKRDINRERRDDLGLLGNVNGVPIEELAVDPCEDDVRELRDGVAEVMATYTPKQRHIIALSLQGHSVREVAEKAQTSEANARRVLKDFKEDLTDRLKSSFAQSGGDLV